MSKKTAKNYPEIGKRLGTLISKLMFVPMAVILLLLSNYSAIAKPITDCMLGGRVYYHGDLLDREDTDYTITLKVNEVELSCQIGSCSDTKPDDYYFAVPMDDDYNVMAKGHPGDFVHIFVNGEEVDETKQQLIRLSSGDTLKNDIHVTEPDLITIPDVTNMAMYLVESSLTNAGFDPANISFEFECSKDPAIGGGFVTRTVPEAGSDVPASEPIIVYVSTGPCPDGDEDGIFDEDDNCPTVPNTDQADADGDGIGDVCDDDDDNDGVLDTEDQCPGYDDKADADEDGIPDGCDNCPTDPDKTEPGTCGCGVADTDTDGDGTPDCNDNCPDDPDKIDPGTCGCGTPDTDSDNDGTPDCNDNCPDDPNKADPGTCGCGVADTDTDNDGTPDCNDNCPDIANPNQEDADGDGIGDACDNEPPVAFDDDYSVDEDNTLVVPALGVFGVLDNDTDADPLTAVQVSGPSNGILAFNADGSFTYTPNANFNGEDSFTYVANDGVEDSNTATVTITINPVNDPPVADAGPDQADVSLGTVELDGGGSIDVDEDAITYNWSINYKPDGSVAVLSESNVVRPTLNIDEYGSYEVRLEVCDDNACDSDTVQIATEGEANLSPVANAGADKTVDQYDEVCLDGSGSSDPNDDEISFNWEITAPDGNPLDLGDLTSGDLTTAQVCFIADQIGDYTATLIVNDGDLDSEPDTVVISADGNSKPVADAGEDRNVNVGEEVCLDGGGSSDPDGDDITYSWSIISPDGTSASLDDATAVAPCFTPDEVGTYVVQLTVTDEHGLPGEPDTVVITGKVDFDGDGIPDEEEMGPDGDSEDYDGNDDLTPDILQDNVASFHTVTEDYVTLVSSGGTSMTNVQAVVNPSPGDAPPEVDFQFGFFEFTVNDIAVGGATTVTITLPDGVTVSTYHKYGLTPDNPTPHWYEFTFDGQTGAEINGNIITLHFIDGQRGDNVFVPDGTVIDPGGPGVSEAIEGDLDGNGIVDRLDVNIILSHRNQPADVCPECDLDGDGMITVLDARKLVLLCTCPRCVCP